SGLIRCWIKTNSTWVKSVMVNVLSVAMDEPGQDGKDPPEPHSKASTGRPKAWVVLASGGLLLVGIGGAVLLAWWTLSFHQYNEQLWMVPVGLVLLGTPVLGWLSVFSSGSCQSLERVQAAAAASPPSLDPER
ncbi:hypothetical protein BHE74_00052362, partial [Ensete ventricosum]